MATRRPTALDQIDGASALGALLADDDLDDAAKTLDRASVRYLLGSLCRLARLMPSVATRLALRTLRRQLAGPRHLP